MSDIDFGNNRPVRLCAETRKFAYDSLHGVYGDDGMKNYCVSLDGEDGFDTLSPPEKYDLAVRRICEGAPIRICEGELLCGSATLGGAVYHYLPATRGGSLFMPSISHLSLGFYRVLDAGLDKMEQKLDEYILQYGENALRRSLKNTARSFRIYHERYLASAPEPLKEMLRKVPLSPPSSFHEATLSLWFTFSFVRLCGNWPGIGRIDEMLGPYLKKDLEAGRITLSRAREILAHFFIKGCEWIRSDTPAGSGDAQHYQNLVIGGIDSDGREVTNEVSYLVLDIIEELGIGDFPVTVRVGKSTPPELIRRACEVIRYGGGVIAFYNEELIINSLCDIGIPVREARRFANDGCWEIQIPGETYFTYIPFDALRLLLHDTLNIDGGRVSYDTFEELYSAYRNNLRRTVDAIKQSVNKNTSPTDDGDTAMDFPCSVVSFFTQDCARTGRSYLGMGAKYNINSPHIGGAPDAGNSLYAIKKLVYDEKRLSLRELCGILHENWENNELLRQYVKNKYTYYGNDFDEADMMTARILDDFAAVTHEANKTCNITFIPGVSTFGRQIEWAPFRCATPFGARAGEILSGNASPTPDTDTRGATCVIKSYCKANLRAQTCGAALDIRLSPTSTDGDGGLDALCSLVYGFCRLGGHFMQLDVADTQTLRDAQLHPENYRTLSVRVSGWNARFITLDRMWQDMVISQFTK